jgi:serine protease AprX
LAAVAGTSGVARETGVAVAAFGGPAAAAIDRGTDPGLEIEWIHDTLGIDGAGIGVATIDSGVNASHDDLGSGRIVHWADFVAHQSVPYDDYGHGTHVAGIIAGSGADSAIRRGVAPGANLIVLKALDGTGNGHIADVVAAVDYAIANRDRFNIRVINLSVAAGVYESWQTDPLTQAALRAVKAGIVVVAAAGNLGVNAAGETQPHSITAPGNAPWVLTVGASDSMGTSDRSDDVVAPFSSRGPGAIDGTPKPDLIAPGVGVESTADPGSALFSVQFRSRVWGTAGTVSQPYLRLSGTSMAAPVVTGTVALMLQAYPRLTPNSVKAILQFTADPRPGADASAQGTGLLNPRGAVALARQFAAGVYDRSVLEQESGGTEFWSRHVIWGRENLFGEALPVVATAWGDSVVWGEPRNTPGEPLTAGAPCSPERTGCGVR